MKKQILLCLLLTAFLFGCTPSQKITSSWVSSDANTADTYKTIFVDALTQRTTIKSSVENSLAATMEAKGYKVVKSMDAFPTSYSGKADADKEAVISKIKQLGCDAILTVSLVDKESETRFVPGATGYIPYAAYGGRFWGYYNYWYPFAYDPGYITTDKTYFLEGNLFDVQSQKLIWSVQTEAYNPTNLEKFSKEYATLLWDRAEKEVIKK